VLVVPIGHAGPSAARTPNILTVGDGSPAIGAWVEMLRNALGGRAIHSAGIEDCSTDRLGDADLIVFPLPAGDGRSHVKAVTHLLKECAHPVLFIPYPDESVERSSS
jgi:hypothetical protein